MKQKGRKTAMILIFALFASAVSVRASEPPVVVDRYQAAFGEGDIQTLMEDKAEELTVNIRKRAEWTDPFDGDAKITLQYRSNSGSITGNEDMDVILIQDKSGSMDSNFGFKTQLVRENLELDDRTDVSWYPIRNFSGYSETAEELVQDPEYKTKLNQDEQGFKGKALCHEETTFNSPCQLENHYYLLINDDAISGAEKGTFVQGNNLYNIFDTDLHHYRKLESREEAVGYLNAGRRVVRGKGMLTAEGNLTVGSEYQYFLDESQIYTFHGNHYLSVVTAECEMSDRLSQSMNLMESLAREIFAKNKNSRIAYIPFWGDVPAAGHWKNSSSFGSPSTLSDDLTKGAITQKAGTDSLDFVESSKLNVLLEQIHHPFTYNGTNWSRAFSMAINYMNRRDEEDRKKKTLIIFLTDGMPQGFQGYPSDVDNPKINGENEITELKKMENTTIYACGVCVNQSDAATWKRVNAADSSGNAAFIRNTGQFGQLLEKIRERMDEQYRITLQGQDAFYTDQLGDSFSLDESRLDNSWKILDVPSSGYAKGVPQNVWNAAGETGITHIYVRSTKTIYWYIDKMTDGDYTAADHQWSFPVKYSSYGVSTRGANQIVRSNSLQRLTYYSSSNLSRLLTVSIVSPYLVFNRQENPELTVTKKIEGANVTENRTFHFVCCKTKQSGQVKEYEKLLTVVVPAGSNTGSACASLEPGGYYLYEVDDNNRIVEDDAVTVTEGKTGPEGRIVVGETPEILTKEIGANFPASATASDGEQPENRNNYLKITSDNAAVTSVSTIKTGDLTVQKEIRSSDEEIWWEHGNPIFLVKISGMGTDGKFYTFHHVFEFTQEYVEKYKKAGKVSMSYTFEEIPISSAYKIEEMCVSRYRLAGITSSDSNVSVTGTQTQAAGSYAEYAIADLVRKPSGTTVVLFNEKENYKNDGHNCLAENHITVEK